MIAGIAVLLATAASCSAGITLSAGTAVPLATDRALSSRTSVKGDMVALHTVDDVSIGGGIVIPRGTPATGQVRESRGTGGMGVDGRLALRPLYIKLGARVVRLTGATLADGGISAGKVAGLLFTPLVSGKSSEIPAGTMIGAVVDKPVDLPHPACNPAP